MLWSEHQVPGYLISATDNTDYFVDILPFGMTDCMLKCWLCFTGGAKSRWWKSCLFNWPVEYPAGSSMGVRALLYRISNLQSISWTVACSQISERRFKFQVLWCRWDE